MGQFVLSRWARSAPPACAVALWVCTAAAPAVDGRRVSKNNHMEARTRRFSQQNIALYSHDCYESGGGKSACCGFSICHSPVPLKVLTATV